MVSINPKLFRRRYIPNEKILLKDDLILENKDNRIITKWETLKPRADFSHGFSCYLLDKGIKISKMINSNNELVYYYCDIIQTEFNELDNAYIFNDLLVDVIIYEDGFVKVLDIGEITDALEQELISVEQAKIALKTLDSLLDIVYSNQFSKYSKIFSQFE